MKSKRRRVTDASFRDSHKADLSEMGKRFAALVKAAFEYEHVEIWNEAYTIKGRYHCEIVKHESRASDQVQQVLGSGRALMWKVYCQREEQALSMFGDNEVKEAAPKHSSKA